MPKFSPADYIIAVASSYWNDDEIPFADELYVFVNSAFAGSGSPSLTDIEVNRPLREDEAVIVSVVFAAYRAAKEAGDPEAVDWVVRGGLAMVAKWAEYLAAVESHPTLSFTPSQEEHT